MYNSDNISILIFVLQLTEENQNYQRKLDDYKTTIDEKTTETEKLKSDIECNEESIQKVCKFLTNTSVAICIIV